MTTSDEDFRTTVLHTLALASRLEGEGQYNIAKLLRAALDSMLRRDAYQIPIPYGVPALGGDMMVAISHLAAHGLDQDLVATIQVGAALMAEGRLTNFSDTPDAYVCRKCGFLVLQPPKDGCPTCGARPITFQRFPPVYWLDALDPYTAVERLRQTPVEVAALLSGLTEEQLDTPLDNGEWAIRQIIAHMLDAQRVLHFRINLMLDQENPQLKSLAVFNWANDEKDRPASTMKILADYSASRQDTLERLETMHLADWWRTGLHQEFGALTIRHQASYFAMHEATHITEITQLRQRWLNPPDDASEVKRLAGAA